MHIVDINTKSLIYYMDTINGEIYHENFKTII